MACFSLKLDSQNSGFCGLVVIGGEAQRTRLGDVAVFGIPNQEWGEEVKAVIELRAGLEPSDKLVTEITEYCIENLAKYKVPKTIDFIDKMPRDDNGKLYKRKLRVPYWEGVEKAI